ncbi:DUF4296 domain-containing protein [Mariniflexile sp.]|uniref:DUF4296 domain-containing protein n=2 Tax=Mariniflexile sp. TaxID=1979402 RepID=UPI0040475BFD
MMLKQIILFLGIILVVTSCNVFGGPKKPKDLISKAKMVAILIDARLISSSNSKYKDTMQKYGVKLDTYVFEKHGIDSLQFALSNEYYAYRAKDYEDIYNKVTDSLETLKTVFNELKLKEEKAKIKREKDSLDYLKLPDSIRSIKMDSLSKNSLKNRLKKEERVMVKPVSDKDLQPPK